MPGVPEVGWGARGEAASEAWAGTLGAPRQGPPDSFRPQWLKQEARVAIPVPRVSVIIPGFSFLLRLSSRGPRGRCNKVRRAPRESRKYIKSQGPLGARGKQGPDSHNLESLTGDHTNNGAGA